VRVDALSLPLVAQISDAPPGSLDWQRVHVRPAKHQMITKVRLMLFGASIMLLSAFFMLSARSARAELISTSVVYAWDETSLKLQNSLVSIVLNNGWVPFLHQLQGPANPNNQFNNTIVVFPTYTLNTKWGGLVSEQMCWSVKPQSICSLHRERKKHLPYPLWNPPAVLI
jgi:hypothetical protein